MTIQQVASSSNNGIMGFLFHDDGSMEGTVLDGAEFARTLHQLLGEEGAASDMPPENDPAGKLAVISETTPLSAELDALAGDFALPAQDLELQPESMSDGDEPDAGKALWSLAAFTDMIGMNHARTTTPTDTAIDGAKALADAARHTPADATAAANDTAVGRHIDQALDLAHGADQAVVQGQQVPLVPQQAMGANGRSAPAGGKFLPQGFRTTANALSQAMAGATARNAQAANVAPDAVAAGSSESAFSAAFNSNFLADLVSGDARAPQNGNSATPNFMQGLNAARIDDPAPATVQSTEEAAPMPQFDSPYLAGSDAWFEDLGTRLEWLTEMNLEKAELQLHPAELGLLEIQISTGDEGTSVSFVTHNPEARVLIEDSMPKLRELLANQGMQLGDSQVSQQSGQQRDAQDMSGIPAGTQRDAGVDDDAPMRRTVYVRDPNRIDHYV
ncbi:MAG TPA: flagellar hook-length control protein FliK [Pseudomonadales bacterium]